MFSKKSQINELNKITIFISVIILDSVLLQPKTSNKQNKTDIVDIDFEYGGGI